MHPTHMTLEQLITSAENLAHERMWEESTAFSNLALIKQNTELKDYLYEIDNKLHEIRSNSWRS